MSNKFFTLVLHSHIPYVLAHGSWPHGMDWLYEAAAESYLPLLDVFRRLRDEGVPPRVNIGFTPVLADQLKDKSFKAGFGEYLDMKIEIAAKDRANFEKTGDKEIVALTVFWQKWYEKLAMDFHETFHEDILDGFRDLQDQGQIEVLTSAATHGYFPLLSRDETIRHQVRQGRHTYRRHFGRDPKGFWIPECAYRPAYTWKPPLGSKEPYPRLGVDEILGAEGIGYFFVDTHLLKGGEAKGVYADRFPGLKLLWEKFQSQYRPAEESSRDPYAAHLAYPSNTPFLVRDDVSGSQVWSRDMGYPGDGWYLEFHKKHFPGGNRYWRITSSGAGLGDKAPYDPKKTRERLADHAAHFISVLEKILKEREDGIVVALYDTELLGHWWFEGPEWLYLVLKGLGRSDVRPMTGSAALEALPRGPLSPFRKGPGDREASTGSGSTKTPPGSGRIFTGSRSKPPGSCPGKTWTRGSGSSSSGKSSSWRARTGRSSSRPGRPAIMPRKGPPSISTGPRGWPAGSSRAVSCPNRRKSS